MDILHNRILWQVLLGGAALVCFATALSWIRAAYRMYKAGDARSLLLPFFDVHVDGYLRDDEANESKSISAAVATTSRENAIRIDHHQQLPGGCDVDRLWVCRCRNIGEATVAL